MRFNIQTDLTAQKKQASNQIDVLAEQARAAYITTGSGQALEYEATITDLKAVSLATPPLNPTDYPWLNAEYQALLSVGDYTFEQVVQIVQSSMSAWISAGAQIKLARRKAKLMISNASHGAEIKQIVNNLSLASPLVNPTAGYSPLTLKGIPNVRYNPIVSSSGSVKTSGSAIVCQGRTVKASGIVRVFGKPKLKIHTKTVIHPGLCWFKPTHKPSVRVSVGLISSPSIIRSSRKAFVTTEIKVFSGIDLISLALNQASVVVEKT